MPFILGVDTGGTYTDAVILENEERIIAFSKALTTHSDLSIGIGSAIQKAGTIGAGTGNAHPGGTALSRGYGGTCGGEPPDQDRA